MSEMSGMAKLIDQYGVGVVAIIIIFVLFGWQFRKNLLNQDAERRENARLLIESNKRNAQVQEEHNANQVKALEKVAESNNNVAEALSLIRDMFVDRTNSITNKQDLMLSQLKTHCVDVNRIESLVVKMQDSVLKTDERTKACVERGK